MGNRMIKYFGLAILIFILTLVIVGCDGNVPTSGQYDVKIKVLDEEEETPLPEVLVEFDGQQKKTDKSGIVHFSNVKEGSYEYQVLTTGYEEKTGDIIVQEDIIQEVELTPFPYKLTFVIEDEKSNHIKGAMVTLDGREEITGEDGKAVFENVGEKTYSYQVIRDYFKTEEDQIEVEEDENETVVLEYIEESYFEVRINNYTEEVEEGKTIEVDYTIKNFGSSVDNQDIEFYVEEDLEDDMVDIELGTLEKFEGTFSYQVKNGDAPEIEFKIVSEDDQILKTISVVETEPAFFEVLSLEIDPEKAIIGEEVTIKADIINSGEVTKSQVIKLYGDFDGVDPVLIDSQEITLTEDELAKLTFSKKIEENIATGDYDIICTTDDDEMSGLLEVGEIFIFDIGSPVIINQSESLIIELANVKGVYNRSFEGTTDVIVETSQLTGIDNDREIEDVVFNSGEAVVEILTAQETEIEAQNNISLPVHLQDVTKNTKLTIEQAVSVEKSTVDPNNDVIISTGETHEIVVTINDKAGDPIEINTTGDLELEPGTNNIIDIIYDWNYGGINQVEVIIEAKNNGSSKQNIIAHEIELDSLVITNPYTIVLEAESPISYQNENSTVTATVTDDNGDPVEGIEVKFTNDGSGYFVGGSNKITGSNGKGTVYYSAQWDDVSDSPITVTGQEQSTQQEAEASIEVEN